LQTIRNPAAYFYQLRPGLSSLPAMFFILFCGGLQKNLPYLQSIHNPAAYFYQLRPGLSSLPAMFFILFCGGLQKHLPYLQTIRNPAVCFYQLRPVELFAFFIFSSTLWRLGKLPELLAGFARPPISSHIFPYLSAHRCSLYNTCMPYSPHSRAMVYFGHSIPTQRCVFYLPHPPRRSFFILKKLKNFFYVLHYLLES